MWKFQAKLDDDNAAHAWDYCTLLKGMIYLIAWAIVCYRLAGLSTTSVLVIAIVPTLFLLLTAGFWETVGIKANGINLL